MKSLFGTLNWKDGIKALIVAMLTVLVSTLWVSLSEGTFPITWEAWKPILIATGAAGLGYILKNWLTNSDGKFLTKESK